jgi:S-adenosylmethionine:tRNA ribosyltransferase-isomerase
MDLSDFHYELPSDLIAQKPLKERDLARLMVVDRSAGSTSDGVFRDVVDYMRNGDCLVLNDTRVVPVRLFGTRKTGGKVEIFLLDTKSDTPDALVRPSARIKEGEEVMLEGGAIATVLGASDAGRYVRFNVPMAEVLKNGHVPLPPYITRPDIPGDKEDYQTVYAAKNGATASPTAGLHFTEGLLGRVKEKGVHIAYVTLHTGYGTFAPVKENRIEDHIMHSEYYEISPQTADTVNSVRGRGGRIFAVGTTSTRVLETAGKDGGRVIPSVGDTNLFIYPGYKFRIIDAVITNFHLPGSTLLMLVSAFAGRELVLRAYAKAVEKKYRFFSYGDAMLIL